MENKSMPDNIVIPVLAYPDIDEAIKWLQNVLGFSLRLKIGNHRAQLYVKDNFAIAITRDDQYKYVNSKNSIMIRIKNIEKHFNDIKASSAKIISEPTDFPFGERQYSVEDPAGHIWTFSQTISNEKPENWGGTSYIL